MDLVTTRRALHAVAELVLAGPQHRGAGTIRLRVVPGGFATVAGPDLRVEGGELVAGDRRWPIDGSTCGTLARAAGLDAAAAPGIYHDGSGIDPQETLSVEAGAAATLLRGFAVGDRALRAFAPGTTPVLWPEHFDLGVTADEVNYGVSPGDAAFPEPYAYVGPHRPRRGPFWTVPFGAARTLRDLLGADSRDGGDLADDAAPVAAFFAQGREHTRRDPVAG